MSTLLTITVFLPLLGSLALFFMPTWSYRTARVVALVTSLATLALSLVLVAGFPVGGKLAGPQVPWLAFGGSSIEFALGLDGISLCLFVLSTVLVVPAIFSSWEAIQERAPAHYGLILALETGLLGLFAAEDVILFYIFFEFTLIPLFFLIGLYGGPQRIKAAITFFLYTLAGSLLTLLGVILLVITYQRHSPDHVLTFSIPELTTGLANLPWGEWSSKRHVHWNESAVGGVFLDEPAGHDLHAPVRRVCDSRCRSSRSNTWLLLAHVEVP